MGGEGGGGGFSFSANRCGWFALFMYVCMYVYMYVCRYVDGGEGR